MTKSRFWQRRIAVSKMTISQQQPWPIKLAMVALVIGLGGAIAMWTYDLGRSFAFGPKFSAERLELLQQQVEQLAGERDKLAATASTIESQQNIEKSTQKQLGDQVKTLTSENLKLKDDLAFFESLMPAATGPEGITVQRIKAEMAAPNQLRYRVLVMQGGKGGRDFSGEMQVSLNLVQAGKPAIMQFPDAKTGEAGKLKLTFRHYQRLEGLITLPDGAIVKTVQVKIMDKGVQRAQQSINL
ncbi:DUF6776 family protein [Undibacterium sp. Ren11W]|uniref:DUF6776 family protein n=1 Tax=Undibacterium sp. Ren11W TaxID=3413045 RepID=UPI003BF0FC78